MWIKENKIINNIEDLGEDIPYGFVYMVTHVPSGKSYIGKKALFHNSKKKLGKKELAAAPKIQGRPAKFKHITVESDWKLYYGSNDEIKNLIKEGKQEEFTREILKICKTSKEASYYETKYQFIYEVLEYPDKWFNNNIEGKYFSVDFIDK